MASTWANLDITDLGRQEEWEDSPEGNPQTPPYGWWNYHDAYGKEACSRTSRTRQSAGAGSAATRLRWV